MLANGLFLCGPLRKTRSFGQFQSKLITGFSLQGDSQTNCSLVSTLINHEVIVPPVIVLPDFISIGAKSVF